jgi:hypothetical protein
MTTLIGTPGTPLSATPVGGQADKIYNIMFVDQSVGDSIPIAVEYFANGTSQAPGIEQFHMTCPYCMRYEGKQKRFIVRSDITPMRVVQTSGEQDVLLAERFRCPNPGPFGGRCNFNVDLAEPGPEFKTFPVKGGKIPIHAMVRMR